LSDYLIPTLSDIKPVEVKALGGGLAGAERTSREMALWSPDPRPVDAIISQDKELLDARGRDVTRNDGYVQGARGLTQDSIVGGQYILNSRPEASMLGAPDGWEEEFQQVVETRFNLIGDSEFAWFDAARKRTFTELVRLAVGSFASVGEAVGVAEWIDRVDRPFKTAVSLINPDRLSNPNDGMDTENIRRGVVNGPFGEPIAYWFRRKHRFDPIPSADTYTWKRVEAYLPWGRPQVCHIYDSTNEPEQTRGIASMVACLKDVRMAKRFSEVELQNAIANAMYAAVIESELPPDTAFAQLGSEQVNPALAGFMTQLQAYVGEAKGITLDGARIPHLFPGTKLHMQPAGQIGDSKFEQRLHRRIAAGLGVSYEEFTGDFSQTNYSSFRGATNVTWKRMTGKKKMVADRFANFIYGNWLEEQISRGDIPLWAGADRSLFYKPMMREAFCAAEWIGAARGQVDEGKETDAAIARLGANLSTLEDENARLGKDWRKTLKQRARERKVATDLGLADPYAAPVVAKPGPKPDTVPPQ